MVTYFDFLYNRRGTTDPVVYVNISVNVNMIQHFSDPNSHNSMMCQNYITAKHLCHGK